MKRIIVILLLISLALGTLSLVSCNINIPGLFPQTTTTNSGGDVINGQQWNVEAPDGGINVTFVLDDFGTPYYKVEDGDITVLDYSALGFTFLEEDLSQMLTFVSEETRTIDITYNNISGKNTEVNARCNELMLTFLGLNYYLDITFRAYDDGYAFRYGVRSVDGGEGTLTVDVERSQFAIPEDSISWIQAYVTNTAGMDCFSYEEAYKRKNPDNFGDAIISMPMLYRAGESDVYSLITESQLIGSGYYGSFLQVPQDSDNQRLLQTVHSPAGIDIENDNVISYPFESPWRLGITGTLEEVVESELVEKLYDDAEYWKPDNYDELSEEEQKTYDYDWVEPGLVAWNWLLASEAQNNWDMQVEYLELAAEMGWKYTILDGGWNSNFKLQEFCELAHSKGIKVIVWCNAFPEFANGNYASLKSKLTYWKSLGIDGIKIDFFDGQTSTTQTHQGEDIETIEYYEMIYQVTAELELVVNCHGANKPTGERRIYPHVLNREAIRGNEMKNVSSAVTVNSMFIRNIIGPTDFTPVVNPLSSGLTVGHQLALAVLYESGLPSMADLASVYQQELYNEFFRELPAVKDETVFLGGELDGYYMAALRVGDDWYVAAINQVMERSVEIDFSFLGDGEYSATYYQDSGDAVTKTIENVNSQMKEILNLAKNGGFVIHLQKQ